MIVSKEEFLLLLTNWTNSSAKVTVLLVHSGTPSSDPLATAFMGVLSGEIARVDESVPLFVVKVGETGMISVGFEGAIFQFKTALDLEASFAGMLAGSGEIDELVTLQLPSGIGVCCVTFVE